MVRSPGFEPGLLTWQASVLTRLDDDRSGCTDELFELNVCKIVQMRSPGFEPGLPAWEADVLDQTGRRPPSLFYNE